MQMCLGQQFLGNLRRGDRNHAEPFDFQSTGNVGERGGFLPVCPGEPGNGEHRKRHVTRAGDIVNLPGTRLQQSSFTRPAGDVHPFPVQRQHHRFQSQHLDQSLGHLLKLCG